MQAEMLDTVVSSNSQELFNFNAEHNGEACIESLDPKDKWTERQFWFTVAMLCVIYGVARKTLEDNIQSLSDDGEFSMADFRRTEKVPASDGRLLRLLRLQEVIGHDNSPTIRRRIIKANSSHRGRLLLTPCNAKRAERSCAQP